MEPSEHNPTENALPEETDKDALTEPEDGEEKLTGDVENKSPLLSHLLALRKVLVISAAAVAVAFVAVFYLAIDPLMNWIIDPIQSRNIQIIYTAMSEALVTKFKVALIAAVVAASPVIIWQIWGFIKPALYPVEKKRFRILFFLALLLFLLGVTFCYFAVYTLALEFFLVAGQDLATPMLSIDKYVSFLFGFIVPFGVAFQLPVALYLTTRMGWTDYQKLSGKRKYVILGVFVLAAILTPPDIVSQVALGVPLCVLYEISVIVARFTKPRERE
ncbi:MAG: twin-arginine translocase subunit TatC [Clostridia bacterium]|nr:twin-arginine translocase subunit TatC [Clostridia bacterium]